MLNTLVSTKPANAEKLTVRSSGTDVATPAIFPTAFGLKFNVSASFLSNVTKAYFEISTITKESAKNCINSIKTST